MTEKKEPAFVKMYLQNVSKNKTVSKVINPVLVEILKRTVRADEENGQRVYLTDNVKSYIAKDCNVSIRRVKQEINDYVESGILFFKGQSVYQLNPRYFGKGSYEDIQNKVRIEKSDMEGKGD